MEVWNHENLLGEDDPIGDIRLGEVSAVWLRASLLTGARDEYAASSLTDVGTSTISFCAPGVGPVGAR